MRRDIRWAAGLFEGEGCATSSDNGYGRRRVVASMNMTDEEPVRWFHSVVGCGTVTRQHPPSHRQAGYKPHFMWKATGSPASAVLNRLLPYLSPRRSRRILALLSGDLRTAREQEAA